MSEVTFCEGCMRTITQINEEGCVSQRCPELSTNSQETFDTMLSEREVSKSTSLPEYIITLERYDEVSIPNDEDMMDAIKAIAYNYGFNIQVTKC